METTLHRLLTLGSSLPNASMRTEHKDLLQQVAKDLKITLNDTDNNKEEAAEAKKIHLRTEVGNGPASAREKFMRQDKQDKQDKQSQLNSSNGVGSSGSNSKSPRRVPVKSSSAKAVSNSAPSSNGNNVGNSDCDISSPEIRSIYEKVRDDSSPINWLALGYGSAKKALQVYGSGSGGLKEFAASLKEGEVTYGYVRMIYGDSQRSKFVFIAYVPDGCSILTKAKANTHKPVVTQYLKFLHIDVYATTLAEMDESLILAKLAAAGGANYGTGGTAAAGSEDFGSIKDNAKNFFQQTEKEGNRQSTVYTKGPLADTTPVALQGRPGITERYLKAL